MKNRLLLSALLALVLHSGRSLAAAETATPPGYRVVAEITINEEGKAEAEHIVESDDFSGDQILNQLALKMAAQVTQPPRVKDGQKVKYKVQVPFDFPVEGDEGRGANDAPKPSIHSAQQPVYPPELGAQGVVGGVIVELSIGVDGSVRNARILRASHPEFAQAADQALQRWLFIPALRDGVAVESRWRIAIVFATDDKQPDLKWRIAPRPSLGSYTVTHSKLAAKEAALTTPAAAPAPSPTPVPNK